MDKDFVFFTPDTSEIWAFLPYLNGADLSLPDTTILGVTLDGLACGAAAMSVEPESRNARLIAMAVDPAVRRQGVGRSLLLRLLLHLRDVDTVTADYRGPTEELQTADAFFHAVWGGVAADCGAVFSLRPDELTQTPLFQRFGHGREDKAVHRFDHLDPCLLADMATEPDFPPALRWNALPGRLHPELSFAWVRNARVEASSAIIEREPGTLEPVLTSRSRRSFVLLPVLAASARAIVNSCPPEYRLEISCVSSVSEGMALRMLGKRFCLGRAHRSVCIIEGDENG